MTNGQFSTKLRPLERNDFDQLLLWLNAPHVSHWWEGTVDIHAVEDKYEPRLSPDSPTRVYVIEAGARSVGIAQCYRHSHYLEWNHAIGIGNADRN